MLWAGKKEERIDSDQRRTGTQKRSWANLINNYDGGKKRTPQGPEPIQAKSQEHDSRVRQSGEKEEMEVNKFCAENV